MIWREEAQWGSVEGGEKRIWGRGKQRYAIYKPWPRGVHQCCTALVYWMFSSLVLFSSHCCIIFITTLHNKGRLLLWMVDTLWHKQHTTWKNFHSFWYFRTARNKSSMRRPSLHPWGNYYRLVIQLRVERTRTIEDSSSGLEIQTAQSLCRSR